MPLLISLTNEHINSFEKAPNDALGKCIGTFDAIELVFELCFADFESRGAETKGKNWKKSLPRQRLDRTTASFLPSATTLMRRFISSPFTLSTQMTGFLGKLKENDVMILVGGNPIGENSSNKDEKLKFSVQQFSRKLLFKISDIVFRSWSDSRLVNAPPHVVHPLSTLVLETMSALEDSTKKSADLTSTTIPKITNKRSMSILAYF